MTNLISIMLLLLALASPAVAVGVRGQAAFGGPSNVVGLVIWMDMSDTNTLFSDIAGTILATNNGPVSRVNDLSGNGVHAYKVSNRPSRRDGSIGSRTSINASGAHYMDLTNSVASPFFTGQPAVSVYAVGVDTNGSASGSGALFITLNSAKNKNMMGLYTRNTSVRQINGRRLESDSAVSVNFATNASVPVLLCGIGDYAGGVLKASVDGSALRSVAYSSGAGTSDTDTPGAITLFHPTVSSAGVFLGELIVYTNKLSQSDHQKVEGYLAWKWGLQTSLPTNHPYYGAAP